MDYLTEEQRQFDDLIKKINEDTAFFKKQDQIFKRILQFNNRSDSSILVNTDSRIITYGNDNLGYTILDADYVVDKQEFHNNLDQFNQFYIKEKSASQNFLNYIDTLELPVAPEVMPPEPEAIEEVVIEVKPYNGKWLQNPENAVWEMQSNIEFEQDNESNLTENLYRTHEGEFILQEIYAAGHETIKRHLTEEAVKTFVMSRNDDYENILAEMGIDITQAVEENSTKNSLTPYEKLVEKINVELTNFSNSLKDLSKDELMSDSNIYELAIKNEIVHYVEEGYLGDDWLETFLESENILDDIYQVYAEQDSNEFFDKIETSVVDYLAQHHELNNEVQVTELDDLSYLEKLDQDTDSEQYIKVSNDELLSNEMSADEVRNMKKHKDRTNIKNFENEGLE